MKYAIAAVLFLFSLPALAGGGGQSMTMTNAEAAAVLGGLTDLGGFHERVVKDGGQEHIVKEPFKFGPGLSLWIAHDIRILRGPMQDYQAAFSALQIEYKADPAKAEAGLAALNKRRITVDLYKLSADELQKDNSIAPATLANLGPILDDGLSSASQKK